MDRVTACVQCWVILSQQVVNKGRSSCENQTVSTAREAHRLARLVGPGQMMKFGRLSNWVQPTVIKMGP